MGKSDEIMADWKKLIVGQDHAIEKIVPYVTRGIAGFNSPNRPVGIFFLMGPTGTGKTRTAETLAELLHGTDKNVLRIDCGEFQMDHEVAKLIGAPPGYLGHRETHPLLSQQRINAMASEKSPFSIVLFDEIEKASASLWRILMGVLDKASLKLGDNSSVDFQRTIIFMSSNIGAAEMRRVLAGSYGFVDSEKITLDALTEVHHKQLAKVSYGAMSRKFPPEFQNRVDEILSYRPLTSEDLRKIGELELEKLQSFLWSSLSNNKAFTIHYDNATIDHITSIGTSIKYGARELKRTINRLLLNRLADDYIEGKIVAGSDVYTYVANGSIEWTININDYNDDYGIREPEREPEPEQPMTKRSRKRINLL